jgi:hypothetical protein
MPVGEREPTWLESLGIFFLIAVCIVLSPIIFAVILIVSIFGGAGVNFLDGLRWLKGRLKKQTKKERKP